ncbi:MAG: asparagine synthase (glutamine-hydrolyzing) [Burkholderiales bacterium]
MCGIAGFHEDASRSADVLRAMVASIRHRGPDAEGFHESGVIHLGNRRLSVVDLAASRQPMFNADRSVAVSFNGEIYNYLELRKSLQALGHRFVTNGDTETLVQGYAAWGTDMLKHLRGMFAFALWDEKAKRLFLARDQLGVKPLYYYWNGRLFAFASELKALLQHPGVPREVDLEALNLYLECQFIPAPCSIFRGVHKLLPGRSLVLEQGRLSQSSYWTPDFSDKLKLSEPEAVDLVDAGLKESVHSMLMADVPLGAFVSGGVDSGLIAAMMAQSAGRRIDTFNVGFAGGVVESEHEHAAKVARHIGSSHHTLMVESKAVLDAFEGWVDIFDEPFGDQAALPTLLLAEFARNNVTVALTGEGADEVFGGYGNYGKRVKEERITGLLGGRWSPWARIFPMLPPVLRKDRILKAAAKPLAERYATIPNIFDEALRPGLYSEAFAGATSKRIAQYAARYFEECNSGSYYDRLLYVDSRLWLPDDLLTKVDRATMAHSLEARVPYLDHVFYETCARLDPGLKLRDGKRKYVLKRVAEKYLPHDIVHREKQVFMMPLKSWLSRELRGRVEHSLGADGLLKRNLFRPEALAKLAADHYSGRKNHSMRLWVLLVLELWFSRYVPDFRL